MKDGIGEGYTRKDHADVSNQLFASYSKVQDARSLASVIGEDELSDTDKLYLKFGTAFETEFVCQGSRENRTLDVHVRTLRTKLGPAGHYIETVRGVGYKIGGQA